MQLQALSCSAKCCSCYWCCWTAFFKAHKLLVGSYCCIKQCFDYWITRATNYKTLKYFLKNNQIFVSYKFCYSKGFLKVDNQIFLVMNTDYSVGPSKSVLVYALHSLENVLGLTRYSDVCAKIILYMFNYSRILFLHITCP